MAKPPELARLDWREHQYIFTHCCASILGNTDSSAMASFEQALEQKTLFKDLLKNDEHERQFRAALRNKEDKLVAYLTSEEVLSDMVRALIDEEGTQTTIHTDTRRKVVTRSF